MKNYQRRKTFKINNEVKEFKSYTKDGFYYKSTEIYGSGKEEKMENHMNFLQNLLKT